MVFFPLSLWFTEKGATEAMDGERRDFCYGEQDKKA